MTNKRAFFCIIFVLNISLSSCANLDSATRTQTTINPKSNPTPTAQITTDVQDNNATIETEVNTPTPFYSAQEFITWTSQIKGCDPPCVWGIIPGKTTVEEFYEILTPHGEIYKEELSDGEAKFTFYINERYSDNYPGYIEVVFIAADQTIEDIALRADLLWPYSDPTLSYILEDWGTPSEIWVKIEIEPGLEWAVFDIRLIYTDVAAIVSILNSELAITEKGYALCPQQIQGDLVVGPLLYFSASPLSSEFGSAEDWIGFKPLNDINFEFNEAMFAEIYKNADTATCIELKE